MGPFTVYEDAAEFRLLLLNSSANDGALKLSLETQACDDKGVCLLPSTLEVVVHLTGGDGPVGPGASQ